METAGDTAVADDGTESAAASTDTADEAGSVQAEDGMAADASPTDEESAEESAEPASADGEESA